MPSRDLDYSPLTSRVALGARLRAMTGDNMKLMGMTVLTLITLGFGIAFVAVVASGGLLSGAGFFTGMFFVGCLLSVGFEVWKSGVDGRLIAFARANRLELVSGENAEHYRGSLFANGSHIVRVSVRTRGESFVEIGERWPVTAPRVSTNTVTNTVSAEARTPELFLRARLQDRLRAGTTASQLVSPELDAELTAFAGHYTIELLGRELTVFGSSRLDPEKPGRMQEAFGLVDRLVEAADVELDDVEAAQATPSGVPIPDLQAPQEPSGEKMGPLSVIGLTLLILIVCPLLFAVVMSVIDDQLRGRGAAAAVVVGLFIAVMMAVVAGLVRLVSKRRKRSVWGRRIAKWIGISVVAFVALGAVVILVQWLNEPGEEELLNEHYREKIELRDDGIVIDGEPRPDCTHDENGWIYCDGKYLPADE